MVERKISDVLNGYNFRTLVGYGLFALTAILPAADAWQRGEPDPVAAPAAPQFGPRGFAGRPPGMHGPFRSSATTGLGTWAWRFTKPFLAAFGTTAAMIILMPFSGCKRYALLFGPPAGFMASVAVSLWLWERTDVYRFEPVLVAVVAALPAGTLWFFCCKRSYERPSEGWIEHAR